MTAPAQRFYGCKPDSAPKHYAFSPHADVLASLPRRYSTRANWPAVYDQGALGSCTGNGFAGVVAYRLVRQGKLTLAAADTPAGTPSRLFIYYNERVLEGTVGEDAGAEIHDGIRTLNTLGTCFEDSWPYAIGRYAHKAPPACYAAARKHRVSQSSRIDNRRLGLLKASVFQDDPVVFGFTVYESFESAAVARTGLVPMPGTAEQAVGGHCEVIVGWDDDLVIGSQRGAFEVRNSWGADWGDRGYQWMPYAYLDNLQLARDFWNIKVAA